MILQNRDPFVRERRLRGLVVLYIRYEMYNQYLLYNMPDAANDHEYGKKAVCRNSK